MLDTLCVHYQTKHLSVCVYMHTYTRVYMCVHIHVYVCIACACVYMHVYVCAYVYTLVKCLSSCCTLKFRFSFAMLEL